VIAARIERDELARLIRFAIVGGTSTLLYAVQALAFEHHGAGALTASLVAYLLSAIFSYTAQRRVTFASDRPHAACIPRFALLNLAGIAVAAASPSILTVGMGLHSIFAIGVTCIVAPAISYVVMRRLVFVTP